MPLNIETKSKIIDWLNNTEPIIYVTSELENNGTFPFLRFINAW